MWTILYTKKRITQDWHHAILYRLLCMTWIGASTFPHMISDAIAVLNLNSASLLSFFSTIQALAQLPLLRIDSYYLHVVRVTKKFSQSPRHLILHAHPKYILPIRRLLLFLPSQPRRLGPLQTYNRPGHNKRYALRHAMVEILLFD
jgi:hypothetical protein